MSSPKTTRRSVSPFGFRPEAESEFAGLNRQFAEAVGEPAEGEKKKLSNWADAKFFPRYLTGLAEATANDAAHLDKICQFALSHRIELEGKGLQTLVLSTMENIFWKKTELFLMSSIVDENGQTKVSVLFSKERDHLIGRYFFPVTESTPADFSGFIQKWISSPDADRLLHFFDFAVGSSDPTFEHYLVFVHPALRRIVSNKTQLRALWKPLETLAAKAAGSEWAARVPKALDF